MLNQFMISDEMGRELHDKATRGVSISETERSQLEAWYARQDASESGKLGTVPRNENVGTLREQVDGALTQLGLATRQIQEIAAANQMLSQEIRSLERRLAQRPVAPLG